jgi:hypothetical protein
MSARLLLFSGVAPAALGCALLAAGGASAQDGSYRHESNGIRDEARVVEPKSFTSSTLTRQFRAFVSSACSGRRLVRLIVAPTDQELGKAVNFSFFLDDVTSAVIEAFVRRNPGLLGQGIGELNVAQALCVGENATALIRNRNRIEQYQLSGTNDSRRWSVGGTEVTLVGFSLHSGAREWISAFLRTKVLPGPDVAASIRDDLERRTGIPTYLILRTDPFFWDMDGPKFDVFEIPVPRISSSEFLRRPYLSCPPSDNKKTCRLETSH